ncbi:beta-N-acetylhexosaminidase [Marinospirillum celere]|uniref:Beta-hexosaminidase n=1 Tax=Marinospirillum celere TaxID=1122252 RepID=A0A1I1E855_9GAMM|nr:beta-N-acetylhexosaminidase [Marinospirillum celere]SFB82876.1 beta-N-acetylhexosaminidase [Marinospirillum celere]
MLAGRLMLDLTGTALSSDEKSLLQHPAVGGVILFARNIQDKQQVAELTGEIRALRPELLLAVDQEGGRVQRLREGFTRLPPLRQLGHLYQLDPLAASQGARLLGQLMASEVLEVDLDFSFAPVLDIDYQQSEVIGDRAFASDLPSLIALAEKYIEGMQLAGMVSVGKHYPGHGYVAADSHTSLPTDERSLETLRSSCLRPFAALAEKLQGIMPAHVIYPAVDDQPAGFSKKWLNLLRDELNFSGMIFSDDLAMAGAKVAGSYPQRARAALDAGCDQVLVCNDRAGALEVLAWMQAEQIEPCEKAAMLHSRLPVARNWLDSPEALVARQLAEQLVADDLQAARQLMVC